MTASWRDVILKEFTPQVARLTLVADPDGLLLEEGVLQAIYERGFELMTFDDQVEFRFAYEAKFRSYWDRGDVTDLVVLLRSPAQRLDDLPYDLLQVGRKLAFHLGDLFPNLSYPVIAALDRCYLDQLYEAQRNFGNLGDNATKDLVLRSVFDIIPEQIQQPTDLLRILLRRHFRNQALPTMLDERLLQILRQKVVFQDWPLAKIVPDRHCFLAFLQERWPLFLDRLSTPMVAGVREDNNIWHFEYPGPADIPFEHDDIRIYVDNLFMAGLLKPVACKDAAKLSRQWVAIGIQSDPEKDRQRQWERVCKSIAASIPSADDRHTQWSAFAWRWAELVALSCEEKIRLTGDNQQTMIRLQKQVDANFLSWCHQRYAGLHNLPPIPPVMLHHIPKFLSHRLKERAQSRIALIVVDGLSLDQWLIVRDGLTAQCPTLRFRESAVYAWIPTLTTVSRQSIFAGKPPLYFPASIHSTAQEATLWNRFWLDHELQPTDIAYVKNLGDGDFSESQRLDDYSQCRVMGLVVAKVDKIMHGMELGTAGMHNQIRQWVNEGYLARLMADLHRQHFQVWLTSDHGNIEAVGCGSPDENRLADVRGTRVRIYPTANLRSQIQQAFPDTTEWPAYGLPPDFLPLMAATRHAFTPEGRRVVGHGGISLEEVMVPFVEVVIEPAGQKEATQ